MEMLEFLTRRKKRETASDTPTPQTPSIMRRFYAVIHVRDDAQAVHNTALAFANGADGVFLIDHARSARELLVTYRTVREHFPGHFFIGLNLLDKTAEHAFAIVESHYPDVSALWVDDAGIDDEVHERATSVLLHRSQSLWGGAYFGSVAFKGHAPVIDSSQTAALASPFVDVVVTSGPETGTPPDLAKIRAMKEAIGDKPLAIASGITPENYHLFAPYADIVMVATGVSHDFHSLDGTKVAALAVAVHTFKAAQKPH